jgi:4-hydroxybenzoate polyprenyltransferase
VIAYLKLFRFPLVFTAVADSAAGYLLVCGPRPDPLTLALLAVASGGLYCFGMAMNDIADRERDKALYPNRVLPSGRLSVRNAVTASVLVLLASAGATVAALGLSYEKLRIWLLMTFAIGVYNFAGKWSVLMGAIRAFNFLLGALAVLSSDEIGQRSAPAYLAGALFFYVAALTFVSTLEDRTRSAPRLVVGTAFMVVAAATPALLGTLSRLGHASSPAGWYGAAPLIAWIIYRAYLADERKGIMLLVRDGVAGIILLDASMLLGSGLVLQGAAVAALLVPAFLLVALFKRLA